MPCFEVGRRELDIGFQVWPHHKFRERHYDAGCLVFSLFLYHSQCGVCLFPLLLSLEWTLSERSATTSPEGEGGQPKHPDSPALLVPGAPFQEQRTKLPPTESDPSVCLDYYRLLRSAVAHHVLSGCGLPRRFPLETLSLEALGLTVTHLALLTPVTWQIHPQLLYLFPKGFGSTPTFPVTLSPRCP